MKRILDTLNFENYITSNAQSIMIENVQTLGSNKTQLDSDKMAVNKKSLSFSIGRILGETKPASISQTEERNARAMEEPRVPMHFGTIHYGAPLYSHQSNYDYAHFESSVRPRACSTPENSEVIPSPTPVYHPHPMLYGHPLPTLNTQQCVSPSEFIYSKQQTEDIKYNVRNIDDPSEKSLDSLGESYQHSPSPLKMKKKKTRTVFSRNQVYQLESAFDMKRYLSSAERTGLATRLNLSETQIKIWFQNRRNKWKRQINGEMDEIPVPQQFAAGYFAAPYGSTSVSPYGRVLDSRDELLRSSLTASAYYSHPYAQESRLRASIL